MHLFDWDSEEFDPLDFSLLISTGAEHDPHIRVECVSRVARYLKPDAKLTLFIYFWIMAHLKSLDIIPHYL